MPNGPVGIAGRSAKPSSDTDGRKRRGEANRQKIVSALFLLIRNGNMKPSASEVAIAAKVGLRTVFRHFDEMESLHREITAQLEQEIMPILLTPFKAQEWRGRLDEVLSRRARVYELVMPFKVSASLLRFQSRYLMDDYNRFLAMERAGLIAVLPNAITNDATLFAAIEMTTSFQAWRRMRQDQALTPEQAEGVIRKILGALLSDYRVSSAT